MIRVPFYMPKRKTSVASLLKSFKFIKVDRRKKNWDTTDYLSSNPVNKAVLEQAMLDVKAKRNIIVQDLTDL